MNYITEIEGLIALVLKAYPLFRNSIKCHHYPKTIN